MISFTNSDASHMAEVLEDYLAFLSESKHKSVKIINEIRITKQQLKRLKAKLDAECPGRYKRKITIYERIRRTQVEH